MTGRRVTQAVFAVLGAAVLLAQGAKPADATNVSGMVLTDTTWTAAGSPYIVTGIVFVDAGVTLTIEPGVVVKFGSGMALRINGALVARGTAESPISFTSNQTSPKPGDWGYIFFEDPSTDASYDEADQYVSGSIVEHAVVEYAGGLGVSNNGALRMDNAHPFVSHTTVQKNGAPGIAAWNLSGYLKVAHSVISGNTGSAGGGATFRSLPDIPNGTADVRISDSTINNNASTGAGGGVYSRVRTLTIEGSSIESNTARGAGGGVHASGNVVEIKDSVVRNCTTNWSGAIYENDCGGGIYINSACYGCGISSYSGSATVSNTHVEHNSAATGGGGICTEGGSVTISRNVVARNTDRDLDTSSPYCGAGIWVRSGSATISENTISYNTSQGQGGAVFVGGTFMTDHSVTITSNAIGNNVALGDGGGVGIGNVSASVSLSGNAVANNTAPNAAGMSYYSLTSQGITGNTFTGNASTNPQDTAALKIVAGANPVMSLNKFAGNPGVYELWNANPESAPVVVAENNWWGTSDPTGIQDRIYDLLDDGTKGRVDFSPYATAPPIGPPISPPTGLTTSVSGDSLTLGWLANQESDAAGYRVHWGTTPGFPYANVVDVGNVTSHTIPGLPRQMIYVAVTAYDTGYRAANDDPATIVNDNQTGGSESWFSEEKAVELVNHAPAADAKSVSTPEDTPVEVTLTGSDQDGNSLTFSAVTSPLHGAISGTPPTVIYTPTANYAGPDSFTYKANDGLLDSAPATVSITVSSVNDAPVLAPIGDRTVEEGKALSFQVSATDVDSATITYSATGTPQGATFDPPTRTFSWTPADGTHGAYPGVTFTASDGSGGSDSETILITVTPMNHAPVCLALAPTIAEDTTGGVTLSCSDVDGDTVTISVSTGPSHGSLSGTVPDLTYAPATNYFGPDGFTYKASDGRLDSAPATASITVTPVNDCPVITPIGNRFVAVGQTLSFQVRGTDVDNASLACTATGLPPGAGFDTVGCAFSWTPTNAAESAYPSVTFCVSDGACPDCETIAITVNHPPSAADDSASTPKGVAAVVDVMANDCDADGDQLTITAVTQGAHGAVTTDSTGVTFTPQAGWVGADSFTYTVSDGRGGTATAMVSVTVTGHLDVAGAVRFGGGEALEGAEVALLGAGGTIVNGPVATDAQGAYTLTIPTPGLPYRVQVRRGAAAGVLPDAFSVRTASFTPQLDQTVVVTLPLVASLGGHVRDSQAAAVASVPLVLANGWNVQGTEYASSSSGVSGGDGTYALRAFARAASRLTATPPSQYLLPAPFVVDLSGGDTTLDVVLTIPPTDTAAPRIISGPMVSGVTDSSAYVQWETDEPAQGVVRVAESGQPPQEVAEAGLATSHTVLLTGLLAGRTYALSVSASDESGNGPVWSATVEFWTSFTQDRVAPVIVGGPVVEQIGDTSAVVRWRTDEPTTGVVRYGLDANVASSMGDPVAAEEHAVTLQGLAADTRHFFKVQAADVAGNGPAESPVTDFTTLPAADQTPPSIVKGPMAVKVSDRGATVVWATDEPSTAVLWYGRASGQDCADQRPVEEVARDTEHLVLLAGLDAATAYCFTVVARDAFGNEAAPSTVETFETGDEVDDDPPVILAGPEVTYLTHRTAIVRWETDEASDGAVEYGVAPDAPAVLGMRAGHTAMTRLHMVSLTGLGADTLHHYRVLSRDPAGNPAGASLVATFRTLPVPVGTPVTCDGPYMMYQSDTTAVVRWTTSVPVSTILDYYPVVQRTPVLRLTDPTPRKEHTVYLKNLLPGVEYEVAVGGLTPVGGAGVAPRGLRRALDAAGPAGWTYIQEGRFTTNALPDTTAPAFDAARPVAVPVRGAERVTVDWGTVEAADTRVRFALQGRAPQVAGRIEDDTGHATALTNLVPGRTYDFIVESIDPSGNRTTSTSFTFTTPPVNTAPVLATIGPRVVREGVPLAFKVSAKDKEQQAGLRYTARPLPPGATLNATTGAFAWTPGFSQAGKYVVKFTVSDGSLTDYENVTITVASPIGGLILKDTFSHAGTKDPDWTVLGGSWLLGGGVWTTRSLAGTNLARVTKVNPANGMKAGIVQAKVRLSGRTGHAMLAFGMLDARRYRYVSFQKGKVLVGQVGTYGQEMAGVLRTIVKPVRTGTWYVVKLGLYADGTVRIHVNGVLWGAHKFRAAVPGGVGAGAVKAASTFDDVTVLDDSVLK